MPRQESDRLYAPPDRESDAVSNRLNRRPEIKLRQLRYFLAGAEYLHFSKAAEAQFVTQSTLSHQIAELELQIGQLLFNRSAKTVRLTQAGEIFRGYATRIVGEVDAGCSALLNLEQLVGGSLRIGATQSFVHRHLGSILGRFMAEHPAVRLHVEELTAPQIEQQLISGQLDLGIAFSPATICDIAAEALENEEMVLVTGVEHRLANLSFVRMADLAFEPLAFLSSDHTSRRHVDDCFRRAGVAPRIVCETNNLALILDLVRSSDIAAVAPSCMVVEKLGLQSIRLTEPTPMRTIGLLRSREHHESAAARLLAAAIRSQFNSISSSKTAEVSSPSLSVC
ncbi:Transcriptional regulator, LysR-family [Pseudomonas syringae pv. philadelphi]|uniref:Transcriptional regulator, LysR-family n=1 Tax=Pseudomonas syringae pv. philadelphi TaxID=251706 RepID=A0A3M3YN28_9PSED|nr:LysR substrate-binding domain-containing protein [Pseudomonas syringae group genomosp. 3]RMO82913.1 Transcriptional regulator, LysR-family [Pseudomonas syringae pv. philadelphi]